MSRQQGRTSLCPLGTRGDPSPTLQPEGAPTALTCSVLPLPGQLMESMGSLSPATSCTPPVTHMHAQKLTQDSPFQNGFTALIT